MKTGIDCRPVNETLLGRWYEYIQNLEVKEHEGKVREEKLGQKKENCKQMTVKGKVEWIMPS